jgi:pimeloyl-ACP methyl ester carboxylesterase
MEGHFFRSTFRPLLRVSRPFSSSYAAFHSSCPAYSSTSSLPTLSFERFGSKDAPHVAVFIHGILGSKKNMRTPAREFVKLNPDFSSIVLDLRGHGATPLLEGDNTMKQCAKDLQRFFELELNGNRIPDMLCAHSLGGKVALKYLEHLFDNGSPLPLNTWILDSLPGKYSFEDVSSDSQSVPRVLEVLKDIPQPFESRQTVMKTLVDQGIAPSIAAWLGTSVIDTNSNGAKGSRWTFDLPILQDLFHDFCELDLWEFLERYHGEPPLATAAATIGKEKDNGMEKGGMIHYVRAGRQKKWTAEVLEKFEKLEVSSGGKIKLHTMPHVGHWLHAEDLPGLLKIMQQNRQQR